MSGRMAVLFKLFGRGATKRLWLVLTVLGVAMVPMLAARWSEGRLELWNVALEDGSGTSREGAFASYFREIFSWWWLAVALVYLLPSVLMPSASSFARDQVLWLRMTPCSARELALGRLWRVLASLSLVGGAGLVAAVVVSQWHDVPCRRSVLTVAGLVAHGLWASGAVLAVGPWLRAPVDRALAAFFAFLMPVVSFLIYATLEPKLSAALRDWWPYTIPFADPPTDPQPHVVAAAICGVVGLLFSVMVQPGHRSSAAPLPEGN